MSEKTLGQIAYEKHYEFLDSLLKKHGGFCKWAELSSQHERDTWEATAQAVAKAASTLSSLISVETRLPEHDQECLCFNGGLWMTAFWNDRTKEWDVYNRGTARWEQFIFTHWQPLPGVPL